MLKILSSLDRRAKIAILASVDTILAVISVILVQVMAGVEPGPAVLLAIVMIVAGGLSILIGPARMMVHAFNINDVVRISLFAACLALAFLGLSWFSGNSVPISSVLLLTVIQACLAIWARTLLAGLLSILNLWSNDQDKVVIYGVGTAGQQLLRMLRGAKNMRPMALVDDNPTLHGTTIGGLEVRSPNDLDDIVKRTGAKTVLVAIPSLEPGRRATIVRRLGTLGAKVMVLPGYVDMIRSGNMLNALQEVDPDELLSREVFDVDFPDMSECYTGTNVLVSGAGGSIGSELCRQVIGHRPAKLVLFELNEFGLYNIQMELTALSAAAGVEIIPVLGSVCDRTLTKSLMKDHSVDVVLHAAAYKHVPLVEYNPLEAARNNVLGTQSMALAARDAGVGRFVLVSTDKAVRPTNVMGATKRLAEQVIQDLQKRSEKTVFSMVRFGNVLGSSGSVIPLFQKQIAEGGPVTVTHPEVTRFFLTIPESARLVLLAGSFAEGGEVFVLDMGKPVNIAELARRMIEISGLSVRDASNPHGDIEVSYVGLRPGEKLYEELLIDDNTISTPHPKIMRAMEGHKSELEVAAAVKRLRDALEDRDNDAIRPLLSSMVAGYNGRKNADDDSQLG